MKVLLSDIAEINARTLDKNYPYQQIKYIDVAAVHSGSVIEKFQVNLSDAPTRAKRIVRDNDILISTVRPNLQHYAFIPKADSNLVASTGFVTVSGSESIDPRFLYYYLTTDEITNYLTAVAESQTSTFPAFRPEVLEKLELEIPPLEKQKEVAEILSSLDEKIELNRRMNATLEAIGQALFKHWFVDNPEKAKWPKRKLGEFIALVNGASYKSEELKPSDTALVTLKSFKRGGGFREDGYKEFSGNLKEDQLVMNGDVVVAHTDVTQQAEVAGVPAFVTGSKRYRQVGISMDVAKVVPRNPILNSAMLYFLLKSEDFQAHKMGYISGTTVLHLSKKCIPEYSVQLPNSVRDSLRISQSLELLIKKISLNEDQTHTLTGIRDSLLPWLMNEKKAQ